MTHWKTLLPLAAAALALAGLLLFLRPTDSPAHGKINPPAPSPSFEPGWEAVDFNALSPGSTLPGWEFRQGALSLTSREGRTVLQQLPDPMLEGIILHVRALPGGGAIRARFSGERTRRAAPRFALAMHSDSKIHLRAVPATRTLEIVLSRPVLEQDKTVEHDVPLASVPWSPDPTVSRPTWLEFSATPDPGGGTRYQGRIWADGTSRPADPSIHWQSPQPPGILRAAVHTAPFALRPVYCDALAIQRAP